MGGLQKVLETFRVSEDMPGEGPQVTDALDKVQLAVEEKYREIRGQIFDFDEVLDGQRKVFYRKRQALLRSDAAATLEIMEEYNKEIVADIVMGQTSDEQEKKAKEDGRPAGSLARSANYVTLVSMDNAWSDHLQNMVNLQENVYLRKYQDLDPADEYKRESLAMFEGLLDKMRLNSIFSLWQSLVPAAEVAAAAA